MWLFLQHRHDSVLTMWLHDLYRTRRPTQNLPPFWGLQLATATFSLYSVITTRSLPTDELMLSQAVMSQTLVISSPPPPPGGLEVSQWTCLSVCLSARISQRLHVKTSRNFLYTLPAAVFWRQRNTLCISGFVDDVTFSYIMGQIQTQSWSLRRSE